MSPLRTSSSRFWKSIIASAGFAVFGFMLSATGVLAHNTFDSSTPADGSVVTTAVREWTLTFAYDVPLSQASAEVVASDGVRTELPAPTRGASEKSVIFSLPPNLSGEVTGRWRLVSEDGHVVAGRVTFTVSPMDDSSTTLQSPQVSVDSDGDSASVVADDDPTSTPEPVRWALRLANFAAIVMFGGLLFVNSHVAEGSMQLSRALHSAKASAIAMTVIPALQLMIFISDVRETSPIGALGHLGMIVDSTPASMMALRSMSGGIFIHLLSSSTVHGFNRQFQLLAGVNAVVHLVALAYVGHSRSQGVPWLGVPIDVVHTAAGAVWLGGLVVFLFIVLPVINEGDSLKAFLRYGEAAKYAVIALIVTGSVQTLRLHGGISTLFTSPHGRWLLLKLGIVSLMLKVGDINRKRLMRSIPTHAPGMTMRRQMLVRASTTEAALGATVIAVTAALVTSSTG